MLPRRTAAEWITVARISRDVGHFFFEGPSDARIVESGLGFPKNVDFREATQIDCDMKGANSLYGGNKYRLLHLADTSARSRCNNIKCFADSDFSVFSRFIMRYDNLFETFISANLPAMTLKFSWLQNVLIKAYGFTLDASVWSFIEDTLRFAFVARYVCAKSEKPCTATSVSDFVSVKSKNFSFDSLKYIIRYYSVSKSEASEIINLINSYITDFNLDVVRACNSNDIFDLIYILLRKSGKISGSSSREMVRQTYMGAFDDQSLYLSEFQALRDWLASFGAQRTE